MTALQYFRQFAPEFNNLSDEIVSGWITSAAVFVPAPDPITEQSKLGNALYAAHLCWMMKYQRGGYRGIIASESAGDGKRSYNAPVGSERVLGQSAYGLQYMQLMGIANHRPAIMTRFG